MQKFVILQMTIIQTNKAYMNNIYIVYFQPAIAFVTYEAT